MLNRYFIKYPCTHTRAMRVKNKTYCYKSDKTKIIFDSYQKAMNFIKFNSNKTQYKICYCETCGGWHITSSKNKLNLNFVQDVINAYERNIAAESELTEIKIN